MLLEIEAWLRAKNESAADSLLEAFEELLTLHRLKGACAAAQYADVGQPDRKHVLPRQAQ